MLILKRVYQFEIISHIRYQFENTSLKPNWKTKNLKLVVVWSFCFGLLLSPPLAWIAKNGIIRALEVLSSPLVINKWVKIIPKTKSGLLLWALTFSPKIKTFSWCSCFLPQEWRVTWSVGEGWVTEWKPLSSPKTPIPFQYTYDLVWNRLEKYISHSIWKRHDQRYIEEQCVQFNKRSS